MPAFSFSFFVCPRDTVTHLSSSPSWLHTVRFIPCDFRVFVVRSLLSSSPVANKTTPLSPPICIRLYVYGTVGKNNRCAFYDITRSPKTTGTPFMYTHFYTAFVRARGVVRAACVDDTMPCTRSKYRFRRNRVYTERVNSIGFYSVRLFSRYS